MRIIGGHDYYDSALAYGQDDDVVFVRDPQVFPDKDCPLYAGYPNEIFAKHYWRDPHVTIKDPVRGLVEIELLPVSIYVAGVHRGGIKVSEKAAGTKIDVFWDYAQFEAWAASHGKTVAGPKKRYKWEKVTAAMDAFPTLREFMSPLSATPDQLTWLVENRVAIAIWCDHEIRFYHRGSDWHCNSAEKGWSLKDFDFPRAVDPYTLFQELSMFVGGVLPRNPNPMVEITDDRIKVAKHGFDKWSFRKHKDG